MGSKATGTTALQGQAPARATARGDATAGRLPDFFIVGHEKCGTTALHAMLSSHPGIYMSELKELRYFAPELRSRFRRLGPGTLPDTLEQYVAMFAAARPEQKIGEASPSYLRSSTAAARIAAARPDARIIAILREPAAYLRSFHLQAVHNHIETQRDFAKALALEPARRSGRRIPRLSQSPPALLYSEHVRYVEQLRRFEAAFGRERMLVLIYEDFRADNAAVVREVLRFIGVDESVALQGVETYRLRGVRSLLLLRTALALSIARKRAATGGPALRAAGALIPAPGRSKTFGRLWERAVYAPPPAPDEALMLELRRRFKPEVVALGEYLARDLVALWGYDRID
jgi:Sulfotransferase family